MKSHDGRNPRVTRFHNPETDQDVEAHLISKESYQRLSAIVGGHATQDEVSILMPVPLNPGLYTTAREGDFLVHVVVGWASMSYEDLIDQGFQPCDPLELE